jgi:hypothetical protein
VFSVRFDAKWRLWKAKTCLINRYYQISWFQNKSSRHTCPLVATMDRVAVDLWSVPSGRKSNAISKGHWETTNRGVQPFLEDRTLAENRIPCTMFVWVLENSESTAQQVTDWPTRQPTQLCISHDSKQVTRHDVSSVSHTCFTEDHHGPSST